MAIEGVKQLKIVPNQGPAQKLLNEGWVLFAVCVKQDGTDQYAEYHLGHADKAEKPPMKISPEAVAKAGQKNKPAALPITPLM